MGRSIIEACRNNSRVNCDDGDGGGSSMFGSQLQTDRIVYLTGAVDEGNIVGVTAQLYAFAGIDTKRPIYLVISTYGGVIDEMFSLYDTIKFLPCPVHTIGLGKIMSAGVLLLACGERGFRQIGENTRIMIHTIRCGIQGNIFEIMNETKQLKETQDLMSKLISQNTKMSEKKITEIMNKGLDYYLTAQEAVSLGIADKILSSKK